MAGFWWWETQTGYATKYNKVWHYAGGQTLFFPNGKSRKGNLQDCVKVELTDFKGDILPDDMSVAECYDLYKIGILTFYLSTCTSSDNITHSDANTMPERNTSESEPGESIQDVDPHNQVDTFPPVTLSGAAVTSVSPRSTQL